MVICVLAGHIVELHVLRIANLISHIPKVFQFPVVVIGVVVRPEVCGSHPAVVTGYGSGFHAFHRPPGTIRDVVGVSVICSIPGTSHRLRSTYFIVGEQGGRVEGIGYFLQLVWERVFIANRVAAIVRGGVRQGV